MDTVYRIKKKSYETTHAVSRINVVVIQWINKSLFKWRMLQQTLTHQNWPIPNMWDSPLNRRR